MQNFYDLPVRSKNSENASQTQKFWFSILFLLLEIRFPQIVTGGRQGSVKDILSYRFFIFVAGICHNPSSYTIPLKNFFHANVLLPVDILILKEYISLYSCNGNMKYWNTMNSRKSLHGICHVLFNLQDHLGLSLFLFYRWKNWGTENFPMAIQKPLFYNS